MIMLALILQHGRGSFGSMNRFRRSKRMHAIVLLATAWSLCACGTTTASQSAAPPHPTNVPVAAEYPAQLRGHWMPEAMRSEEHTSELQSLMRISYAVFCLKKQIN